MTDTALLVPRPQQSALAEPWDIPLTVHAAPVDEETQPVLDAALDNLAGELARRGVELRQETFGHVELRLVLGSEVSQRRGEAYELHVGPSGVELTAAEPVGLYRGLGTLVQWLRLHPPERQVKGLHVVDWPDVERRGVMLDVSRNRVPRMNELYALVDLLSELKLNELQLYVEHTFAYSGHEAVWQGWSPLRADEMRRLEGYARRRAVELVPNQNSFGHFHRWLIHEPYRQLAECPQGIDHPFSPEPEPFSLCPLDLGSLRLLRDLYSQLLPHFRSPRINVGFDETLDLGRCRSQRACEERGSGRVYLDFLLRVRALVAEHHRRVMCWADVLLEQPELVTRLPKDVMPMIWGYEADHDFAGAIAKLAGADLDIYLCPGTAAWNSFTGRPRTAVANLAGAARQSAGTAGYLITDWGDHGHLQPPPISWPAYVAGAAFAWNRSLAQRPDELPLEALLDRHVLRDEAGEAGKALCLLGAAQEEMAVRSDNGTPLFFAFMFADKPASERRGAGLTTGDLETSRQAFDQALQSLSRAGMKRPDAALVRNELEWAASAAKLGASLAAARLEAGEDEPVESLPATVRQRLCGDLDRLAAELEPLWLARSRSGGLTASVERLTALRPRLL